MTRWFLPIVDDPQPTEDEVEKVIEATRRLRPGFRIVTWTGTLEGSLKLIDEAVTRLAHRPGG